MSEKSLVEGEVTQLFESLESTRAHFFEIRLNGNGTFENPFDKSKEKSLFNYYSADRIYSKGTNENRSDFPKHFARLVEAALNFEGQAKIGGFESRSIKILQEEVSRQQFLSFL